LAKTRIVVVTIKPHIKGLNKDVAFSGIGATNKVIYTRCEEKRKDV